jgi:hypothetical protein
VSGFGCVAVGSLLFAIGAGLFYYPGYYPGTRPYQTYGIVVVIAGLAVQILGVVLLAMATKRISAAPGHPETWGRVYGDAAYRPYGDFDSRGSFPVVTADAPLFPDRAVCPICGTRYDPRGARFCARDGTELRAVR